MTLTHARSIIESLVHGLDPIAGGDIPPDSPYQHVDVTRALFMAAQALAAPSSTPRAPGPQPVNASLPWTETDDQSLCADYEAGMRATELAEKY